MWFPLALLTALFESGKDLFGKKSLRSGADEYLVAWAWRLLALPFLLPLLPAAAGVTLGPAFWPALAAGGGLNVVAAVLYMKALRHSDLSLCVPLITFTPLFLLVTSPLMLGEAPHPRGIFGVVLIAGGAYLLNLGRRRQGGRLEPLRALLRDRGARLMLAVALLWSVTANIDKIGLQNSSPLVWAVAINGAIALGMAPLVWHRARRIRLGSKASLPLLLAMGLCGGLTTLCQMLAISQTQVPYVIAVKRLSILLSVLAGHLLLGERGLRERLPAALAMLAGVVVLLLA